MFALHSAAGAGDANRVLEILQNRLSSGCLKDRLGRTAIHCAVENKKKAAVERIIGKFHIDVINLGDNFGRTPLHCAAEREATRTLCNCCLTMVLMLTPLSRAAWRGWQECVSLLLRHKARSDIADQNGQVPLHLAAKRGHGGAAKIIMKHLVWTSVNGNHVFRNLERADGWQNDFADIGHDVDVLVWAALNGIECMTLRLIRSGVDIELCSSIGSMCTVQAAGDSGHTRMVELLLGNEADVNGPPVPYYGRTALHAAAGGGYTEMVELLLNKDADVNAPPAEYNGRTALQAAAGGGHIKIVQLLLDNKAEVNTPPAKLLGRTALQAAEEAGHIDIVKLLTAANAQLSQLQYPGHIFKWWNQLSIIHTR